MAFKNYLKDGSYSIIDSVTYSKQSLSLRFQLKIYEDESRQIELASKSFDISGRSEIRELAAVIREPVADAKLGDWYLVSKNPCEAWKTRASTLTSLNEQGWGFWGFHPKEIFYFAESDSYFTLNVNQMLQRTYPLADGRLWNKWFAVDKVFSSTSNIYTQIYKFLKTLPEFASVLDV